MKNTRKREHSTARHEPRIGKTHGIFAPSLPPSASAGGRCSRAAMAAPSARRGRLPQRRAARRGAAEHSLDRRRRRGDGSASGVSQGEGLGTAGFGKPVIRGWSNYFRIGVAKEVFIDLDNFMYWRAQRYMKRRHPTKSGWWRTERYRGCPIGTRRDRWVFMDKDHHATLRKFAWIRITRHRLVPTTYSPDDPTLQDYWRQRQNSTPTTGGRVGQLTRRQQGVCPVCHQPLENGEGLHMHHVMPKKNGGQDELANLRLVHDTCHRQIHSTSAPLGVRRLLEPCTR